MPVEIKELIIRAVVSAANETPASPTSESSTKPASEKAVADALEQMAILINNKKER